MSNPNIIQDLFCDANAVSTRAGARAFEISEPEARSWASEIGVSQIGSAFVWTEADVEELAQQLDELEAEEEAEAAEEDFDEEEDDEEEEDEEEDDEDE